MESEIPDITNISLQTMDKLTIRAITVSVFKNGGAHAREECEEHLQELGLLAETYGINVVHKIPCAVRRYDAATYVTEGKLQEILDAVQLYKANLVIFDDEIAPSQQRNLEKALGVSVIDRTEVILGVFANRARTSEARLQVELAKVKYQAPRLRRLWTHLSRQHGSGGSSGSGGGHTKGEGEKQIELDRRLLRRKIDLLQKELEEVKAHRETQRLSRERSEVPSVGIIGYTNAGKSTLLNALTGAGVFVEDKLFATLDTTTRKFSLPNHQEILLTDTVGFIRKLPHLLVAAFKSTLEEAFLADILLHLVDISHPMAIEQADTTHEVLKQLNAEGKPMITVLNKIDLVTDQAIIEKFKAKYPKSIELSAITHQGFDKLIEAIVDDLSKRRKIIHLRIPQAQYAVVSEIRRLGHVIEQEYDENDVLISVDLPNHVIERYKQYINV